MNIQIGNWWFFLGIHPRSIYVRVWRVCLNCSTEHSSGRLFNFYLCD